MARRAGVFVAFYWSDTVVNGTIGKFIGDTIDIVIVYIYIYVHSAKRGARARARRNECPAQNNAGLSLHQKYNGGIARTKHPMTPDRREIQSCKKEPTGMRRGKKRNDGVKVGEGDVSIRSLSKTRKRILVIVH